MSGSNPLDELRRAIDAVDDELLDLLNRRAALTIEVGEVKRREGSDSEFYRPDREAKILRRLAEANTGPMPNEQLVRLVREVISTCLSLEKRLQVGYLGPAGTFTHGHLPPEPIDELIRVARPGARCVIGVNAGHFAAHGFGDWFEAAADDGRIEALEVHRVATYADSDPMVADQMSDIVVFTVRSGAAHTR